MASSGFLEALTGETEGNPFFIEEVVRHLHESAGELLGALACRTPGCPRASARSPRAVCGA